MSDEQLNDEIPEEGVEEPGLFDYTDESESTTDAGEQYRRGDSDSSSDDDYDGPFSQDLRTLAKSYDMSDDDLSQFDTPDQLRAAMTLMDKAYTSNSEDIHPDDVEVTYTDDTPRKKLFEHSDLGIDENAFEPEAVTLFQKLQDRDNARVDQLTQMAEDLENMKGIHVDHAERQQMEQTMRFQQDMDAFFQSLEGFEDVFGVENIADVPGGSPKYNNRMELVREMDALVVSDRHMGRSFSVAEIQQRALRLLHGDRMQEGARAEIRSQVNKRRGTARPTNRQGDGLSGEERARKKLNDKYRELGFDLTPVRDSSDF